MNTSPGSSINGHTGPATRLRIAVIGVGKYSLNHLERLNGNSTVSVVGLCDVSPASLARARAAYPDLLADARSFADYRPMLEETRPDAVLICSPHCDHYRQVADCLDAGLHILVEKPLVNNSQQADEIVSKARSAGVIVGIAYQRHGMAPLRYIHQNIKAGRWGGKVLSVCAYQQEGWKEATTGTWRHQPEISGGGYLHDGGSHLVDLVLWTTGLTPVSVSAVQDRGDAPVDVSTVMSIAFGGGALGSLSLMGDVPGWGQRMVIGCEKATLVYSTAGGLSVQLPDGSAADIPEASMPPETDVVTNFLNAIQKGEPILAPLSCGVAVMRLTEAAMESARSQSRLTSLTTSPLTPTLSQTTQADPLPRAEPPAFAKPPAVALRR